VVPSHRTPLPGVRCKRLLGSYAAAQPSNGKELLSVSWIPPIPSWEQFLGRRATSHCLPRGPSPAPMTCGQGAEEVTRLPRAAVAWVGMVLNALCLQCSLSWMPFVFTSFCLGCWPSWVLWDTRCTPSPVFPLSLGALCASGA